MVKNIILYVRRVIPSRRTNYFSYRYLHIIFRSVVALLFCWRTEIRKEKKITFLYLWTFRVSWRFAYKFTNGICIRKRTEIHSARMKVARKRVITKCSNQNHYALFVSNSALSPFSSLRPSIRRIDFFSSSVVLCVHFKLAHVPNFQVQDCSCWFLFSLFVTCELHCSRGT